MKFSHVFQSYFLVIFACNLVWAASITRDADDRLKELDDLFKSGNKGILKAKLAKLTDEDASAVLISAAKHRNYFIFEILLDKKSGKNLNNINSVFLDSITDGEVILVEILLAKRNEITIDLVGKGLIEASRIGDLDIVELLLVKRYDITKEHAGKGLVEASKYGHVRIVDYLLETGHDMSDDFSIQALREAYKNEDLTMIELLLGLTAGIATYDASEILRLASRDGKIKIVELLLDSREDISTDFAGQGLIEASRRGHLSIAKLIFDKRPDISPSRAGEGFLEAAKKRHLEVAILLLELRPKIAASYFFKELFEFFSEIFQSVFSGLNPSTSGQILVIVSATNAGAVIVKMVLDIRDDIENAFIKKCLLVASKNGLVDILTILLNSRYEIDSLSVGEAFIEASRRGHSDAVIVLIKTRPGDITYQIAGEGIQKASQSGQFDMVEFLLNSSYRIDGSFLRQGLLQSSKNNHLRVYNGLLEIMDPNDVESVRQSRIDSVRKVNLDYDPNSTKFKRVGLVNNNAKCCRIISLVSSLFNTPPFREALYLSDFKNEPSLKLAELFAQMQLGNENIRMEESFVQYFKAYFPDHESTFWYSILDLRSNILDILPAETKNIFQVSLRISDSENPDAKFVNVINNFITVSRGYKKLSEAISSKFSFDAHYNLSVEKSSIISESQEKQEEELNSSRNRWDQIEILNRPKILMFGIISSDNSEKDSKYMELDLTLTLPSSTGINQCEYVLQAICYENKALGHHMSYIRDLPRHEKNNDLWYRYDDDGVEPIVEEHHKRSMMKNSDTTATFALYIRSDVPAPVPE